MKASWPNTVHRIPPLAGKTPAFVSPISWIRAPYDDRQPRSLESESRPTSIWEGAQSAHLGEACGTKFEAPVFVCDVPTDADPAYSQRQGSFLDLGPVSPEGADLREYSHVSGARPGTPSMDVVVPRRLGEEPHRGRPDSALLLGPQIPLSESRAGPARATLPRVARAALPLRAFEVVSWTVSGSIRDRLRGLGH